MKIIEAADLDDVPESTRNDVLKIVKRSHAVSSNHKSPVDFFSPFVTKL